MRQKPNIKRIAIFSAVPLLVLGWAAFRPELIFVNKQVNETDLKQKAGNQLLAEGTFASYAHETVGKAEILDSGSEKFLQLSGFKTSNGPDVHVYLIKGTDAQKVTDGNYIDLGVIKGNQGTQNYKLPADFNLSDYGSVNIWCKRFSVAFGGATLNPSKSVSFHAPLKSENRSLAGSTVVPSGQWQTVAFDPAAEILVTKGSIEPKVSFKGSVKLVERNGKRFVRFEGLKNLPDFETQFVKKESLSIGFDLSKTELVKLGTIKAGQKGAEFEVSKELDVWLYRSVSFTNPKTGKVFGFANLRSEQELKRKNLLLV